MYLSVIKVNPKYNIGLCKDAQEVHRSIMRLFDKNRKEEKVLFSEQLIGLSEQYYYVQSENEPKENGDRLQIVKTQKIDSTDYTYKRGDILRVDLITVPYKKQESKVIPLVNIDQKNEWIKRTFEKHGAIVGKILNEKRLSSYTVTHIYNGIPASFQVAPFQYSLLVQVSDPRLFAESYEAGIGRNKAYGCGMLIVHKVHAS